MGFGDARTVCGSARVVVGLAAVLGLTAAVVGPALLGWLPGFEAAVAYLIPAPYVLVVCLCVRLVRLGPGRMSAWVWLAGAVFFVGGAAFDLAATAVHSPDLSREANPVLRALLDHGRGVGFVYAYGVMLATLAALVNCLLWAALIRHAPVWARRSHRRASTPGRFLLKAVTGKTVGRWRDLLEPLSRTDRMRALYHVLWTLVPLRLGAQLNRWYLGATWCRLTPQVEAPWIALTGAALFELATLVWLWRHCRSAVPVSEA